MRRFFPLLALLPLLLLTLQSATACTIVSAVAKDGQVWNMNNEDGPAGIANFINVFPRTAGQTYGYYTLSYLTPGAGAGGNAQGGMNEAGLTFDFNAIDYVEDFDPASRQAYPGGNDPILAHIMGTMRSVDEVIAFFDTYWFVNGFRGAQMHVADRDGKFAIISASGEREEALPRARSWRYNCGASSWRLLPEPSIPLESRLRMLAEFLGSESLKASATIPAVSPVQASVPAEGHNQAVEIGDQYQAKHCRHRPQLAQEQWFIFLKGRNKGGK